MSYEHDQLSRLVDYHDHIAAPPVPLADDVLRGRRRVRRNRGLLAGGVALGVASVIAAVSLVTGGGPALPPQPVDPPTTTSTSDPKPENPGLSAPLVAPKSILEVRELGFHMEGMQVFGVDLLPDRQQTEVAMSGASFVVEVYYQGKAPGLLASDQPREEVSIHGTAGTFFARYEDGGYASYLLWEHAPDSWAAVRRVDQSNISRKTELLTIAEAIRPGGTMPVRLPFRLGTASASLLQAGTVVGVHMSPPYWDVSFESGLGLNINRAANGSSCDPPLDPEYFVQPFTYRGYAGCLKGIGSDESQVDSVVLQVEGTERSISKWARATYRGGAINDDPPSLTGSDIEDFKQLLAEITMTPSQDPATWFDLATALGG